MCIVKIMEWLQPSTEIINVLPATRPDVFRRIAEREPIRMQGFILKPFLLALENSDFFKLVDISKCKHKL